MELVATTKERIIEKSFQLLLSKGYDGVSITDIQKATGISRGLLYHYFGNKEALFMEVTKQNFINLFDVDLELVKDYNVVQMADYIVDKYHEFINETLHDVSILNYDFLFYRALRENHELAVLFDKIRNVELSAWLLALNNSLNRGELRESVSTEKLAFQFIYLSDGVWLQAVTPSSNVDLIVSLKKAFETLLSLIQR